MRNNHVVFHHIIDFNYAMEHLIYTCNYELSLNDIGNGMAASSHYQIHFSFCLKILYKLLKKSLETV